MREARVLAEEELHTGLRAAFEREIHAEDVASFAALSGDRNPLHTDAAYAQGTNYGARIVHGAFQVGLASTMAGMYLPGRNVVVGGMNSRFPAPLYFPAKVQVTGEITAWNSAASSGMLRVQVIETTNATLTAEIHVSFSLHERSQSAQAPAPTAGRGDSTLPVVVVTGAAGAVGKLLLERLSGSCQLIAAVRSRPVENSAGIEVAQCDLSNEGWQANLDDTLAGRPVYGIVHTAWPGVPQGSLLQVDASTLSRQVEFGSAGTVRLAAWLAQRARGPARLIVLSSAAATHTPELRMAAYSMGKAAMEHAVRLLAPELAGRQITINAIAPSFMPVGMNSAKTQRAILTETAKVPAGRLCSPEDIAHCVEYLLSPQASFVTGQVMMLTGGQL